MFHSMLRAVETIIHANMRRMKTWGASARGVLMNVLFSLWAQLCAQWVATDASAALDGSVRIALAVALLVVLALEPFLLRQRFQDLANRLARSGKLAWGASFEVTHGVWLAIAHLLLGPVMVMVAAAGAFGSPFHPVGVVALFLAVAREVWLFQLVLSPPPAQEALPVTSPLRRTLVSAGLLAVSCVGFAATWLPIAARGEPINQLNLVATLLYASIVGLLFLLFYLPSRLAWVVEESLFQETRGRTWALRLSLALAVLSALRPLVVVEEGRWFMSEQRAHDLAKRRR